MCGCRTRIAQCLGFSATGRRHEAGLKRGDAVSQFSADQPAASTLPPTPARSRRGRPTGWCREYSRVAGPVARRQRPPLPLRRCRASGRPILPSCSDIASLPHKIGPAVQRRRRPIGSGACGFSQLRPGPSFRRCEPPSQPDSLLLTIDLSLNAEFLCRYLRRRPRFVAGRAYRCVSPAHCGRRGIGPRSAAPIAVLSWIIVKGLARTATSRGSAPIARLFG
jgi:hypothetical protein